MFGNDDDDKTANADNQSGDQAPSEVIAPTTDDNNDSGASDWQHPGAPVATDNAIDDTPPASPSPASDTPLPTGLANEPSGPPPPAPEPASAPPIPVPPPTPAPTPHLPPPPPTPPTPQLDSSGDNELIDLKREALTKLSPLVDQLDQPPDEKFRTLMMMIQASDDQHMVRHAYDTALAIEDEKERAQALLDIVNEINYFTQNPTQQ